MLLRTLAIASLLACAFTAAPAGAAPPSAALVTDCQHASARPASIIFACGDGTEYASHIHWQAWGGAYAIGHGTLAINPCTPDCASSKTVDRYPIVLIASALGSCAGHGHVYRRVEYDVSPKARVLPAHHSLGPDLALGCPR